MTNMASGMLGVIGPVDFSLSAGVIAATGCASRFALVPAGLGILACAFFPALIQVLALIPGPVVGALLFYLMVSQLASGLTMLSAEKSANNFISGIIVALPLMVGLLIAFAPPAVFAAFPVMIRPLIGNGFVMGVLAVVILEHGIFRCREN
jgi:xanthine/uracil permease